MILDRRGLVAVGGTSYGVVEETNCCRCATGQLRGFRYRGARSIESRKVEIGKD